MATTCIESKRLSQLGRIYAVATYVFMFRCWNSGRMSYVCLFIFFQEKREWERERERERERVRETSDDASTKILKYTMTNPVIQNFLLLMKVFTKREYCIPSYCGSENCLRFLSFTDYDSYYYFHLFSPSSHAMHNSWLVFTSGWKKSWLSRGVQTVQSTSNRFGGETRLVALQKQAITRNKGI